tara:strand:- start:216 stop:782 length:567 start_codon:yes stop_codon:yes gene_type:complete
MGEGLKIIIGPMFSGKSSELIRKVNRLRAIGKTVLVFNSEKDTRSQNTTKTHDDYTLEAIKSSVVYSSTDPEYKNWEHREKMMHAEVIAIDEAQFFPNLYSTVKNLIEIDKKYVIVCGLDGDFEQKSFGEILKLIPISDKVIKLNAMCTECKNGTPAPFTKRITKSKDKILIGGSQDYISVCRYHLRM